MTYDTNSTIKIYKNNNIQIVGNYIGNDLDYDLNNKIYLVLKKNNYNYIGLTQKNITYNLSKKNKQIFLTKKKDPKTIYKNFLEINDISLVDNNYLFSTNDFSNNSIIKFNYNLYNIYNDFAGIRCIDLSNTLLNNLYNFHNISSILYKKTHNFSIEKYEIDSNKINNIKYYAPYSFNIELNKVKKNSEVYYELTEIGDITINNIDDLSSSGISIAYSNEYNIYVGLVNSYSNNKYQCYYFTFDNNNINLLNNINVNILKDISLNTIDIAYGYSINWIKETEQFFINGINSNYNLIVLATTNIDLSNNNIIWEKNFTSNYKFNHNIDNNFTLNEKIIVNKLDYSLLSNEIIIYGITSDNNAYYSNGKIQHNIDGSNINWNNSSEKKDISFSSISKILYINKINKYFSIGMYKENNLAVYTISSNITNISNNPNIIDNSLNYAIYDAIYIEKYNKIYGLAEYSDKNEINNNICYLLTWDISDTNIVYKNKYVLDTKGQYNIKEIASDLLITCGRSYNDGSFNSSYNKIYLDNGEISKIISVDIIPNNNNNTQFINFDYNTDISMRSLAFIGNKDNKYLLQLYNLDISNNLKDDISNQILNIDYFNNNHYIDKPRIFELILNPTVIDVYQTLSTTYKVVYNLQTVEYEPIIYSSKIYPTNLNNSITNNFYKLFYNNKVFTFNNIIEISYDKVLNEFLITSKNRDFAGILKCQIISDNDGYFLPYKHIKTVIINFIFNIKCNPVKCPSIGLPHMLQMSHNGSNSTFRKQFSHKIRNATKRKTIIVKK